MDELLLAYGNGEDGGEDGGEDDGDGCERVEAAFVPRRARRVDAEGRGTAGGGGDAAGAAPSGGDATHAGKTRTFGHVVGSFPTHVFVPLRPCRAARAQLESLVAGACAAIPGLRPMEEGSPEGGRIGLHMSLSRTCPTRRGQHRTILQGLRKQLRRQQQWAAALEFDVGSPIVLTNDERTRTFVCLQLHASAAGARRGLDAFVRAVDIVFRQHGLQTYYADPVHHVSIAWMLGDDGETVRAMLRERWLGAVAAARAGPGRWAARADAVVCRIGSVDHSVVGEEAPS